MIFSVNVLVTVNSKSVNIWSHLLKKSLMENFIFCAVHDEIDAYVTVNVIKLIIMHISRLLSIISSPIGKYDEKRKFYEIFRLFCIIFTLNGEF